MADTPHPVETNEVKATEPNATESETIEIVTIRHDIEHTRNDISETLDALKEKLSPQVLLDQAKEHAKDVAVDAMDQAKENVKENVSAAVENVKETVGGAVSSAREKVEDVVHNVSETVSSAMQTAKDKVGDALGMNKDKGANSSESADGRINVGRNADGWAFPSRNRGGIMAGAQSAGTTVIDTVKRNPLPSALIGLGAVYLVMKHQDAAKSSGGNRGDYDYTDYDPLYPASAPLSVDDEADVVVDEVIIITEDGADALSNSGSYARSGGNRNTPGAGGTLLDTIQSNPLPAALAVLGTTWLLLKNRDENKTPRYPDYRDYDDDYNSPSVGSRVGGAVDAVKSKAGQVGEAVSGAVSSAKDKVGDTVSTAKDKVGDVVDATKDKVGDVVDTTKHKVGDAMDTAKSKAGDLVDSAKTAASTAKDKAVQVTGQAKAKVSDLSSQALEQTRKAGDAVTDTYQANPLAYGLVALGIGAAVALLLPRTEQENRLMGDTRDQIFNKAQASVQDITQKVQAVAETTLDQAKNTAMQEAKNQGLSGE